jgi:hypothetical protein
LPVAPASVSERGERRASSGSRSHAWRILPNAGQQRRRRRAELDDAPADERGGRVEYNDHFPIARRARALADLDAPATGATWEQRRRVGRQPVPAAASPYTRPSMNTYTVTREAAVPAPADRVYGIIADYCRGHPRILPRRVFSNLVVEEGGVGNGTRIRFDVTAFGRTTTARATITEPEPGRVLVETIPEQRVVTTFTVVPEGPDRCRASISTRLPRRGGPGGWIERLVTRRFLERVYAQELRQLGAASTQSNPPA